MRTFLFACFPTHSARVIFKGDEASYLARVEEFGVTDEDFTKVIMNDYLAKEYYNLTEKVYWHTLDNKKALIKGRIIGGCLDLISTLAGTKYDGIKEFNEKYKKDGIIWYFDNCEITKEETIRTIWKLSELDYFKYTTCIIFGRFGSEVTTYGYDVKTCLEDSVISKLNIPTIYDADLTHKSPCMTIINGSIATINVENGKGSISFELK